MNELHRFSCSFRTLVLASVGLISCCQVVSGEIIDVYPTGGSPITKGSTALIPYSTVPTVRPALGPFDKTNPHPTFSGEAPVYGRASINNSLANIANSALVLPLLTEAALSPALQYYRDNLPQDTVPTEQGFYKISPSTLNYPKSYSSDPSVKWWTTSGCPGCSPAQWVASFDRAQYSKLTFGSCTEATAGCKCYSDDCISPCIQMSYHYVDKEETGGGGGVAAFCIVKNPNNVEFEDLTIHSYERTKIDAQTAIALLMENQEQNQNILQKIIDKIAVLPQDNQHLTTDQTYTDSQGVVTTVHSQIKPLYDAPNVLIGKNPAPVTHEIVSTRPATSTDPATTTKTSTESTTKNITNIKNYPIVKNGSVQQNSSDCALCSMGSVIKEIAKNGKDLATQLQKLEVTSEPLGELPAIEFTFGEIAQGLSKILPPPLVSNFTFRSLDPNGIVPVLPSGSCPAPMPLNFFGNHIDLSFEAICQLKERFWGAFVALLLFFIPLHLLVHFAKNNRNIF